MIKTLTITYDKSNEDIPVMCVSENNLFSIAVVKIFTGEKAEQLFKELTGQNLNDTKIIKSEEEGVWKEVLCDKGGLYERNVN